MEDILEFILSILFMPFESKYDNFKNKINKIPSKVLKVFLKILLILIPLALIFGLCCLAVTYLEDIGYNKRTMTFRVS